MAPNRTPIPMWRKALYALGPLVLLLLGAEALLALAPGRAVVRDQPVERGEYVLCVGDSVTAGTGLGRGQSWPERLQKSLEPHGIPVVREAAPGAGLAWASEHAVPAIEASQDGVPLVLVMLGHNDQVRFEPGAGRALRAHRFEELGDPHQGWKGPRLFRFLRWGVQDGVPGVAGIEHLRAVFAAHLPPLIEAAETRGGRVTLVTYLIPGPPPAELDEDAAELLVDVRAAQATVNALLRTEALDRGLGLIDLEHDVPVGATWNTEQWLDHIHPSEHLTRDMGDHIEHILIPEESP